MQVLYSLGLGYLVGCFSPAALIAKRKHVDLKKEGTTNLGATNTALVLGTGFGFIVMIVDILKGVFSVYLGKRLFPALAAGGMVAGLGCMIGHCFPVTNRFKGGKGLASFGGLVLAFSPRIFLALASLGVALMVLLNTGVAVPISAGVLFPVAVYVKSGNLTQTLAAAEAAVFLIGMHMGNLKKAIRKKDVVTTREFFKYHFLKKKDPLGEEQENQLT